MAGARSAAEQGEQNTQAVFFIYRTLLNNNKEQNLQLVIWELFLNKLYFVQSKG